MNNSRPQHFTTNGLSRARKRHKNPNLSGLEVLNSLQKKKKVKTKISEEAAKQIAMVLKGMLHKKK